MTMIIPYCILIKTFWISGCISSERDLYDEDLSRQLQERVMLNPVSVHKFTIKAKDSAKNAHKKMDSRIGYSRYPPSFFFRCQKA
jgi:hypothetical protein